MPSQEPQGRLDITLLQERSSGTFARVYLAEASGGGGIRRLVAVKVLREQWADAQEFVTRTSDEARMLSRLRHPNIVRVEDLTLLNGKLAIVMEFIDGVDLKQLVDTLQERDQRLPPRTVFEIMAKVASALDAGYRKTPRGHDKPLRIVHRDIKPSNVMITAEGEVKVLDFGTARGAFEGRQANTAAIRFGSLKYMSPERRDGDRGDHGGDIYSIGLMLLELLEGRWLSLLPGGPEHGRAMEAATRELSETGMRAPDWDAAVRKILLQLCADNVDQRPDAEQVARLFHAFADQAWGPSLATFCAESLTSVVETVHKDSGGALTGERLTIRANSSDDRPAVSRLPDPAPRHEPTTQPELTLPEVAPAPGRRRPSGAPQEELAPVKAVDSPVSAPERRDVRVPDTHRASAPRTSPRSPTRPPSTGPKPPPGPGQRPLPRRSVAPRTGGPTPPPRPGAAARPVVPPLSTAMEPVPVAHAGGRSVPIGRITPNQVPPHEAAQPLEEDEARPTSFEPTGPSLALDGAVADIRPARPTKKEGGVLKLLAGVVVGGFLLFAVLGIGGAVVYTMLSPDAPLAGPDRDPVDAPVGAVGTPVEVTMAEDTVQWVKLQNASGATLIKGGGSGLDGEAPPGDYTLGVKVVGRSTVEAPMKVGRTALSYDCALDSKIMEVSCVNTLDADDTLLLVAD